MATLFEMKEYDYFCYVLTDALTPWQAHKEYGQRAVAETWIEEAKNQTALAQIKTDDFWANRPVHVPQFCSHHWKNYRLFKVCSQV